MSKKNRDKKNRHIKAYKQINDNVKKKNRKITALAVAVTVAFAGAYGCSVMADNGVFDDDEDDDTYSGHSTGGWHYFSSWTSGSKSSDSSIKKSGTVSKSSGYSGVKGFGFSS